MWLICRVVFIYIHIRTSLSVNLSHFYLFSLLLLRTTCHELYNGSHAQLLHTKWPQMRTTLNPTLALDAIEFSSCKRASIKSGWDGDTWDYINYLQKNIFQIILIMAGDYVRRPTIINWDLLRIPTTHSQVLNCSISFRQLVHFREIEEHDVRSH